MIVDSVSDGEQCKAERETTQLPPPPSPSTGKKYIDFYIFWSITYFPQNLVCSFKDEEETKRGQAKVKIVWEPPKGKFSK